MDSHSTTHDLEEYISGHLSAADASLVQDHLDACEECQLRLAEIAVQIQWTGPERRNEPRIPVNFPGRLKLLDPVTSIGPPHDVEIIEISRGGLKIRSLRSMIPKTLVQVRFGGKAALGEVRYCVGTEAAHHVGVKLVKDFPS